MIEGGNPCDGERVIMEKSGGMELARVLRLLSRLMRHEVLACADEAVSD
jgi:hypothetical protein